MDIQIRLDYATINFAPQTMSYTRISKFLLNDPTALRWTQKGLSGNFIVSPFGLKWLEDNGYSEMPHKLEISGVGCSHFGDVLPDLVNQAPHRFSRLDFAFDVLVKKNDWKSFIVSAFESSLYSDRERKKYRLTGSGEAMTIYIGSRKSAKFFRIYNKTLEDAKYDFYGNGSPIPDDSFVIRYEVELKRHKVKAQNDVRCFDPSPAFDWYYGSPEDQNKLCDEIKSMWLSFGDDVLLPDGFASADISVLNKNNFYFVQKSVDARLSEIQAALHDFPHSFDHTLNYLVRNYGKYIPYVVSDSDYMRECEDACKTAFGFVPEYYLEPSKPYGFYDLDEAEPIISVSDPPCSFEQMVFGQIDNFDESEV